MRKKVSWLLAIVLLLVISMSSIASAAILASQYITSYEAGVTSPSDNKIKVSFSIIATETVDMVGVKTIILQERASLTDEWSAVETYSYLDYANMMRENAIITSSNVTYSEAIGGYHYRAKVYFYAENGGYDTREYITSSVQAKP